MGTRTIIWVFFGAAAGLSLFNSAYTAAIIFGCTGMVMHVLHVIEVKVNRILDDLRIQVRDEDLD